MYELTEKMERAVQTVESLIENLPMQYRLMCLPFLPQCRQLLTNIPDEELVKLLDAIRAKLDYIENGDPADV